MQTGTTGTQEATFNLAHNPTKGFFPDLLEATVETLLGPLAPLGLMTGNVRQVAAKMQTASGSWKAHSLGAITTLNALRSMPAGSLGRLTIQVFGSGANHQSLAAQATRVGATWLPPAVNPGDSVPLIAGRNASDLSKVAVGIWNSWKLFDSTISPHSTYYCTQVCGP